MATNQAWHGVPTLTAGNGVLISNGVGNGASWSSIELDLKNNREFNELNLRMEKIEERLAILHPSFGLHDKFPALKEAYEQYKIIERLVNENHGK